MKRCGVTIVQGEHLQLVDANGQPFKMVGMVALPWAWRGALLAYEAPPVAVPPSVAVDTRFQSLLDTIRGAASDAHACGRDFGTGQAIDDAEAALASYVDGLVAAARSAI